MRLLLAIIANYVDRLLGLVEHLAGRKPAFPPSRIPPPPSLAVANAWVRVAARIGAEAPVWHIAEELDAAEADWLRDGGFLADVRLAETGRNYFSLRSGGIRGAVSLKVYFANGAGCSPARLAEADFRLGKAALVNGIPVAAPLGWGHGPGFALLAMRLFPDAVPLADQEGKMPDDALLDAVCQLSGRLLAGGFRHPGLDSRRILARPVGAGWELALSDLRGVVAGQSFDPSRAADILGWAVPFFQNLPAKEREERFAAAIRSTPGSELTWHGLEGQWAEKTGRRWAGRRRLCARGSDLCRAGKTPSGNAYLGASGIEPSLLEGLVAAVQRGDKGTTVLKHDTKRQLWRVRQDGGCYVVKRYVRGAAFAKVNRGRQAWLAAALLEFLHIGCATCHGLLWDAARDCYLVMEDVGSSDVHTLLKEHPQDRALARRVLALAAAYLALLHRRGIWHRDMKCSNFVVAGEADRILLCDLEDTALRRCISERMALRSFVQFLSYLPGTVPARQRLRFLAIYAQERGMPRAEFRRLYAALKRAGGARIWQGS